MNRPRTAAVAALIAVGLAAAPAAHEIPRDVTVHAFVKAEDARLRVRLRMPIAALRDIQFPLHQDGSIDASRAEPAVREGVQQWLLPGLEIREDDVPLVSPAVETVSVSPSGEFEVALAYAIRSDRSAFSIRPGFERLGLRVLTSLRFETPDGAVRPYELRGDPGLVRLDPRWHHAAWQFTKVGFFHILDGADHLLFLLCLVIPFRRLRPLILVVTAFTVAHSLTLAGSAYGLVPDALWFPPLVETLIAASIVYMALENIVTGASKRRWLVAFGFGLVHGFGFSFALRDTMQFAGSHLLTSLLFFNVGVEIGQVLVLIALVPVLQWLFRVIDARMGAIVLSALIAHTAWHWMADRWGALRQFPVPELDAAALAVGTRVLLVVVAVAAGIWLAGRLRPAAGTTSAPDA